MSRSKPGEEKGNFRAKRDFYIAHGHSALIGPCGGSGSIDSSHGQFLREALNSTANSNIFLGSVSWFFSPRTTGSFCCKLWRWINFHFWENDIVIMTDEKCKQYYKTQSSQTMDNEQERLLAQSYPRHLIPYSLTNRACIACYGGVGQRNQPEEIFFLPPSRLANCLWGSLDLH